MTTQGEFWNWKQLLAIIAPMRSCFTSDEDFSCVSTLKDGCGIVTKECCYIIQGKKLCGYYAIVHVQLLVHRPSVTFLQTLETILHTCIS